MDAARRAAGAAIIERSVVIAGVTVNVRASLRLLEPLTVTTPSGERDLDFVLSYEVSDGRGTVRRAEAPVKGRVLLDGTGSIATHALGFPEEIEQHLHQPPRSQSLPGVGSFGSIDVYFEPNARVER